jgi:urease beta subunit
LAEDPVKRGFPRLRSLNADAFHSIEAVKGPAIIECVAKFQGDDCVNIHGTYHLVTASHENELRVAVAAGGRLTIEPGDEVEFLPYEGKRPADARAVKAEPDAPLTETEWAFIEKSQMDASLHQRLLSSQARVFKLTLDRAVPLPMGSGVCSGNRVGNGCLVTDCDFGFNRSRGIIIKASRAKVIANRISHSWMTAVLVAPEFFWWHEAASSSDVLIEGNGILGCRCPAIEVVAPGANGQPLPSGAHRNITIRRNTIAQSVWPNIRVTSTDGLVILGNRLTPAEPERFVPPLPARWDWGTNPPAAILTESCDQTKVQSSLAKRR